MQLFIFAFISPYPEGYKGMKKRRVGCSVSRFLLPLSCVGFVICCMQNKRGSFSCYRESWGEGKKKKKYFLCLKTVADVCGNKKAIILVLS